MYREQLYLYNGNRSLRLYYLVHDYPISYTITLSRTRIIPSRTRFQGRPGWAFCCKRSKNVRMSTNEETARTIIRVREAEKSHGIRTFSKGRGAKKKNPNCIQIRVLPWCRKWDSNPHGVLAQRILSPPRLPIPSFRLNTKCIVAYSFPKGKDFPLENRETPSMLPYGSRPFLRVGSGRVWLLRVLRRENSSITSPGW